jgi:hypothetical protein
MFKTNGIGNYCTPMYKYKNACLNFRGSAIEIPV